MRFNLSEWALRNRQIVLFLMLLQGDGHSDPLARCDRAGGLAPGH